MFPGLGGDSTPGILVNRAFIGTGVALAVVFLAGLAFAATNPAIVGAMLAITIFGVAFAYLVLSRPTGALAVLFLAQILLPVYIRIPLVPGIPALPPALVLLVALIVLVIVAEMLHGLPRSPSGNRNVLTALILVYAGVLLLSILINRSYSSAAVFMTITIAIPVAVYFVTLRLLPNIKEVEKIYFAVHIAGILAGLLALHEFFSDYNIVARHLGPAVTQDADFVVWYLTTGRSESGDDSLYRVFSFFTNPLEYGVFAIMVYPYALLRFVEPQPLGRKFVNGIALLTIVAGLLISFSRGPALAFACVTIALAIPVKPVRLWLAAGTSAIAGGLVLAWPWIGAQLSERVQGVQNVTLRFKLWENAVKIFSDNPVFGIGYGNYSQLHAETLRTNKIGPFDDFSWDRIEKIRTIESIYLSLAAETGLLGLAAFFALIIGHFVLGYRLLKVLPLGSARTIVLSSLASSLGFLVSGLTVANNMLYTPSILFFGLLMSSVAIVARDQSQSSR